MAIDPTAPGIVKEGGDPHKGRANAVTVAEVKPPPTSDSGWQDRSNEGMKK